MKAARQPRAAKTAGYDGIGAGRFVNWARLYCRAPELETHEGRTSWIDALSLKRNRAIADLMVDITRRGGRVAPKLERAIELVDRYTEEPLADGDPVARDRNDRAAKFDGFEQASLLDDEPALSEDAA